MKRSFDEEIVLPRRPVANDTRFATFHELQLCNRHIAGTPLLPRSILEVIGAYMAQKGPMMFFVEPHPDGGRVFTVAKRGEEKKQLRTMSTETTFDGSFTVSPDCTKAMVWTTNGILMEWDIATGACKQILRSYMRVSPALAMSPDNTAILYGWEDGTLLRWDRATDHITRFFVKATHVSSAATLSDGTVLIAGAFLDDVWVFNFYTGEIVSGFKGDRTYVRSVAMSRDGATFLFVTATGHLHICDVSTGGCRGGVVCGNGPISMDISLDGTVVAFGDGEGNVCVYDLLPGGVAKTMPTRHRSGVKRVAVTPDGKGIFSCDATNEGRMWDIETGKYVSIDLPMTPVHVSFCK